MTDLLPAPSRPDGRATTTATVVLDTSALVADADGVFDAYPDVDLVLPLTVIEELDGLKKRLDQHFPPHNAFGVKVDRRPFHPHITIATRDLTKAQFLEAWPGFEHRPLEAEWTASHISLLRHNGQTWNVVREIPFP